MKKLEEYDYLMENLIGLKIKEIRLDVNKEILEFDTDQGTLIYEAYGDCCSSSWIEHLNNLSEPNATVISVEEKDISDKNSEDGEEKFYFYTIKTDKGDIDIEMRNSSNGYYGGSINYKGLKK